MINCKKIYLLSVLVAMALVSMPLQAGDGTDNIEKHPWLKGVSLPMVPTYITPVIPLDIYYGASEPFPKEISEDETITVTADSEIFFGEPPTEDRDMKILNPAWETKSAVVTWRVVDIGDNKSEKCDLRNDLPLNQMEITPLNPTDSGSIECFVARKMSYDNQETGERVKCFANATRGHLVKVKDITPPTCGLQITVKGGGSATISTVENPPNEFPLPKHADIIIQGDLINGDPEYQEVVQGFELGPEMVAPNEEAGVHISKKDIVSLAVIGDDNYKLNNEKIRYGICGAAGGEPVAIGEENQPEYDLSKMILPNTTFFYLVAEDMAGNKEVLFVPVIFK